MRISDLSSDVCSSDLPQLSPTRLQDTPYLNFPLRNLNPDAVDVLSDDQVLLSMQYSTQWDSMGHVGALFDADGDGRAELCYYNGYHAGTAIVGTADSDHFGYGCKSGGTSPALTLGVDNLAWQGLQGRGAFVIGPCGVTNCMFGKYHG